MDKLYSQYIKAVINHGPTHLKQDWCCTVISLGNHRSPRCPLYTGLNYMLKSMNEENEIVLNRQWFVIYIYPLRHVLL
jgi:hypothetical protein